MLVWSTKIKENSYHRTDAVILTKTTGIGAAVPTERTFCWFCLQPWKKVVCRYVWVYTYVRTGKKILCASSTAGGSANVVWVCAWRLCSINSSTLVLLCHSLPPLWSTRALVCADWSAGTAALLSSLQGLGEGYSHPSILLLALAESVFSGFCLH